MVHAMANDSLLKAAQSTAAAVFSPDQGLLPLLPQRVRAAPVEADELSDMH